MSFSPSFSLRPPSYSSLSLLQKEQKQKANTIRQQAFQQAWRQIASQSAVPLIQNSINISA